jgi:hypothetical protein
MRVYRKDENARHRESDPGNTQKALRCDLDQRSNSPVMERARNTSGARRGKWPTLQMERGFAREPHQHRTSRCL